MSKNRLSDYLSHIIQAASEACSYVDGLTREDFLDDRRTQDAVTMKLIIIGEAATKIMANYSDFVEMHDGIPWRSMRGMRNQIAHGYYDIELDIIWETVHKALPALLVSLQAISFDE